MFTKQNERNAIIDGQQRITTFTLLLIYILHNYKEHIDKTRISIEKVIYVDNCGKYRFNLQIENRNK